MNRQDKTPPMSDEDFDAYLAGDSELSQAYQRQAPEWPDHSTDEAIRRAAHRGLPSARPRWQLIWPRLAGATAVVALCAVVVTALLPESAQTPSAQRVSLPPAPAAAPTDALPGAMPDAEAELAPQAESVAAKRGPETNLIEQLAGARRVNDPDRNRSRQRSGVPAAEEVTVTASRAAPDATPDITADASQAQIAEAVNMAAARLDDAGLVTRESVSAADGPAAGHFAELAGADEPARAAARESSPARMSDRAGTLASGAPASGALAPAAAPPRAPEAWLAEITDTLTAGRVEEAREMLAAFREVYPDYAVSDTLRALEEDDGR